MVTADGAVKPLSILCIDVRVLRFLDEQHPDHEREQRHADRIPEPGINIALRRHNRERRRRQEAAEPAIAYVVGQRHRRITNARREHLHEHRSDRPINHRHIDDEQRQNDHCHRPIQLGRVGLRWIARALERGAKRLGERRTLFLRTGSLAVIRVDRRIADLDLRDRTGRRRDVRIVQAGFRQRALHHVARTREARGANRVELERTLGRISDHDDRRLLRRGFERRVRVMRERLEEREVCQRGNQAADHDDRLATDPI